MYSRVGPAVIRIRIVWRCYLPQLLGIARWSVNFEILGGGHGHIARTGVLKCDEKEGARDRSSRRHGGLLRQKMISWKPAKESAS